MGRQIARIAGWLMLLVVLVITGYLVLMSGMWHKPASLFATSGALGPGSSILVAGATGATGVEIVRELRARGAEVTAMVRASSDTRELEALGASLMVADALDAAQVRAAFAPGAYRAVVSALGTSVSDLPERTNFIKALIVGPVQMDPNKRPDFIGNRNLMDAALAAGTRRFVLITVVGTGDSFAAVPIPARRGHGGVIPEKEKAEVYLRESGLDYTIIRPGGLGNVTATGKAVLTPDPRAFSYISRTDLARLVVEAAGDDAAIGKTFNAYDPERLQLWSLFVD